jgi:hypothetical protein
VGDREKLRLALLELQPIAHNYRPATPPDFSAEDPDLWTTGTPAMHSIALPPRGPMVDAVIDTILASDWLRDTLAAERERCAKVAEGWLVWNSIGQLSTAHRARNDMARSIAHFIRNLEPEEKDDARG